MGDISRRLAEMGLDLPKRSSVGKYVGARRSGDVVYVSGGGPLRREGGFITGKVGADVSIEAAREAAKLCALYCLASLQEELGDLDRVSGVVKVVGFVNSAPGFSQQHVVVDGASELLLQLFGDKGAHARSSVGVAELPMNIAVEVEMIVEAPSGSTGSAVG